MINSNLFDGMVTSLLIIGAVAGAAIFGFAAYVLPWVSALLRGWMCSA